MIQWYLQMCSLHVREHSLLLTQELHNLSSQWVSTVPRKKSWIHKRINQTPWLSQPCTFGEAQDNFFSHIVKDILIMVKWALLATINCGIALTTILPIHSEWHVRRLVANNMSRKRVLQYFGKKYYIYSFHLYDSIIRVQ